MKKNKKQQVFGTGAKESPKDPRTVVHHDIVMAGTPLTKGGIPYTKPDIENQHRVGICTAISLTQNRARANGKKYSADFQYLLQKKYYDLNWTEGSSIFSALKVGKNFGFLPASEWHWTSEDDRDNSYADYIALLKAVPQPEIQRLIGLCVDKIAGYAEVDILDTQKLARAISDSEAGILCMYRVGEEWYTPSWMTADIDPLRPPKTVISGHAIGMIEYDYTKNYMQRLANTWGTAWNREGQATVNYGNYRMREAWTVLPTAPVIPPFKFNNNLWFGLTSLDVKELQKRLGFDLTMQTGFFGLKTLGAVIAYQTANGILPTGFVGPITRGSLNK